VRDAEAGAAPGAPWREPPAVFASLAAGAAEAAAGDPEAADVEI
jgi:hypothetical protein